MSTKGTLLFTILCCVLPGLTWSQNTNTRIEHETSEHTFLSEEKNYGFVNYEVCNLSGEASTFFWAGARFGVDGKDLLLDEYCVRKTDSPLPHEELVVETSPVFSRYWQDTFVPTLTYCPERFLDDGGSCDRELLDRMGKRFLELEIFARDPDGAQYPVSQSSFRFEPNDEQVVIGIDQDVGEGQSLISFPQSNLGNDDLSAIIEVIEGDVSFVEFGGFLAELGYVDDANFDGASRGAILIFGSASIGVPSNDDLGNALVSYHLSDDFYVFSDFTLQATQ